MAGLFLGGIFNIVDPIFSIQLYKWSWGLLLFLALVIWLAYRYGKWEPYKPLWGIYHAFKAGSKAAFIFNRRMTAELLSERDAKCIFAFEDLDFEGLRTWGDLGGRRIPVLSGILDWLWKKLWYYPTVFLPNIDPLHGIMYKLSHVNMDVEIAKKMQNYEWDDKHSVLSGGIMLDIILDADRWSVKDSPQHKAIVRAASAWNEVNGKDQIWAYAKFARKVMSGELECPEGVRMVEIVPWPRMDAGCPINIEDNVMAGARRQEAKDDEEQNNSPFAKYYFPLAVGGFLFAALLLGVRLSIVWMNHHP